MKHGMKLVIVMSMLFVGIIETAGLGALRGASRQLIRGARRMGTAAENSATTSLNGVRPALRDRMNNFGSFLKTNPSVVLAGSAAGGLVGLGLYDSINNNNNKNDEIDKRTQAFMNLVDRYGSGKEDKSSILEAFKVAADDNLNIMQELAKKIELGIATKDDEKLFHHMKDELMPHYYELLKELDGDFAQNVHMSKDAWVRTFYDRFTGVDVGNTLSALGAQRTDKLVEDVSQGVKSADLLLRKAQEASESDAQLNILANQLAKKKDEAVRLINILSSDLDKAYNKLEVAKNEYQPSEVLIDLEKKIVDQKEKILKLSTDVYGETAREKKENIHYRKDLQYEKKSLVSPWPTTKISNLIYDYSPAPVLSFMNALKDTPSNISQKLHDVFYARTGLGKSLLQQAAAAREERKKIEEDLEIAKKSLNASMSKKDLNNLKKFMKSMRNDIQMFKDIEDVMESRFRALDRSNLEKYNAHQVEIDLNQKKQKQSVHNATKNLMLDAIKKAGNLDQSENVKALQKLMPVSTSNPVVLLNQTPEPVIDQPNTLSQDLPKNEVSK